MVAQEKRKNNHGKVVLPLCPKAKSGIYGLLFAGNNSSNVISFRVVWRFCLCCNFAN